MQCKFTSDTPQTTARLAGILAAELKGGEIIFLRGPIGAGKTLFVKHAAQKIGVTGAPVSASFSLFKEYTGKGKRMFHLDLFRLEEKDMFNLGFEEILSDKKAIVFAEWPEAAEAFFPADRLEMDFKLEKGNKREITLKSYGEGSAALLQKICAKIK